MVEGTRLESVRRLTPTAGSNPAPSATFTLGIWLNSEYIHFMSLSARGLLVCGCIWGFLGLLIITGCFKTAESQRQQKITQSIENQRTIGEAYAAYLADNNGSYPRVNGGAGVGGKMGTAIDGKGKPLPVVIATLYGASTAEKDRPLNAYIENVNSFHDPADIGGGAYNVASAWESFGNSYQPQVADDMFRVKRVLGEDSEEKGSYEGTSMHESEITKASNKIIQGDFNWPYDREDAWHAKQSEARHIMLYADGHAAEFVFPPTKKMMKWIAPPPHGNMPDPDPNYIWW